MASSSKLHFFDIESSLTGPSRSWSPNTLRVRLALNYKRIPYTQSFITYPSIAPLLKSLSVPPFTDQPHAYTLPAITHASIPTPGHTLPDSYPIALHLDATFSGPEHPALFPTPSSYALALAVRHVLADPWKASRPLVVPAVAPILDPVGREYFERTRAAAYGKPLSEVQPRGEAREEAIKAVEKGLGPVAEMLRGKPGVEKEGPFFEGAVAGWADFVLVGWFGWVERADKAAWKRFLAVGEGEFERLWAACRPWLEGQGEEREWKVGETTV